MNFLPGAEQRPVDFSLYDGHGAHFDRQAMHTDLLESRRFKQQSTSHISLLQRIESLVELIGHEIAPFMTHWVANVDSF